jgi:hypothetical protein
MSLLYKLYSVVVLGTLHLFNFYLCEGFIRPVLLPLLFTTNDKRLINSIHLYLKELNINDDISFDQIKNLNLSKNNSENWKSKKLYGLSFDLLVSFSLQLIGLFLFDIIHVTAFEIRHFDWYITLSILIFGLTYLLPAYLVYNWIFEKPNDLNNNINFKIVNLFATLIIWSLIIYSSYLFTITRHVDGNFLQISLYLLSLFGVSCLSILNGMGCIMGCYDLKQWVNGEEVVLLNNQEIELSIELRNLEFLLLQQDNSKIWTQLIRIESILRDISIKKASQRGIFYFIKLTSWIYCIYKVIFGIIKIFQSILNAILINNVTRIEDNNKDVYHGSGDLLSNTIAKIIIILFYNNEPNYELLEKITMIINFGISISFFIFSIQNVLLTLKNLRTISKTLIELNEFNKFNRFNRLQNNINFMRFKGKSNRLFKSLFICEMTGIYVVSTALLLNSTNMPIHLSKFFISEEDWKVGRLVLNNSVIDIEFINNWFDRWFGFGCLGTILFLILLDKYQTIDIIDCNNV